MTSGFQRTSAAARGGEPLRSSLRGKVLDSELSQPLGERAPEPRPLGVPERDVPHDPYPVHFDRLLRLNEERRGEEAARGGCHEGASRHLGRADRVRLIPPSCAPSLRGLLSCSGRRYGRRPARDLSITVGARLGANPGRVAGGGPDRRKPA
jgi:hypothetical protein